MAVICPTVTATDPHEYRQQMERIASFAERLHVDFMDGLFARTRSPDLKQAWWPHSIPTDLHLMYQRPDVYLEEIVRLRPTLVIVHAEAEGGFVAFADRLHQEGIQVGVALLQDSEPELIEPALKRIDHVLLFSGSLGRFGGEADLHLLGKIIKLKKMKASLEIGWDGGINAHNVRQLMKGGVDVLNVGGAIQKAKDPAAAYAKLVEAIGAQHDRKTDT